MLCFFLSKGERSKNPRSPNFVPSIFHHTSEEEKRKLVARLDTFERRLESKRRRINEVRRVEAAQGLLNLSSDLGPMLDESDSESESDETSDPILEESNNEAQLQIDQIPTIPTQQNAESLDCLNEKCKQKIQNLKDECQALRTENIKLKDKLKKVCFNDLMDFEGDDEKVKTLTGIATFSILMATFNVVSKHLSRNSLLSPFQQFFLTLLTLRMNLSHKFVSYMYGVHETTIARRFRHCIDKLYDCLVTPLILWPDREELRQTLPYIFRNNRFKNCVCIIDCFEIFLEKANNLLASAQSYSSYKSHCTLKYLIGVSPQGTVSFISYGWGGRTSDKHITENCGILDKLLPGDLVLADRGFNCSESVNYYQATLQIPAFTRGKAQLDPVDLEDTRGLAAVRINVERVIGVVRQKYTILQGTLPITMTDVCDNSNVMIIDKIVKVCCALTNLAEQIV